MGSVDLEYQAKAPTISCILLVPSFERGGESSSGVGLCVLLIRSLLALLSLARDVVWMGLDVGICVACS